MELWLNKEERDDLMFQESLKPLCLQYKECNYLVALFFSGEEDLYLRTRDLLLYNRRRTAERAVELEKNMGQAAKT